MPDVLSPGDVGVLLRPPRRAGGYPPYPWAEWMDELDGRRCFVVETVVDLVEVTAEDDENEWPEYGVRVLVKPEWVRVTGRYEKSEYETAPSYYAGQGRYRPEYVRALNYGGGPFADAFDRFHQVYRAAYARRGLGRVRPEGRELPPKWGRGFPPPLAGAAARVRDGTAAREDLERVMDFLALAADAGSFAGGQDY